MTENEKEIALLKSDPHALLLKYQGTIRIIAERYVRSGLFDAGDLQDTIQAVNVGLLERIPTITKYYDGSSLLVTYLSAVIRNICLHLHKKRNIQYQPLGNTDPEDPAGDRVLEQIALNEAVEGLREVLELQYRDKARLLVLLQLYFRLPLDEWTVVRAYPRASPEEIRTVLEELGSGVADKHELDLFNRAAPFLNRMEKKTTSGDGYRHWLGTRMPEILQLLKIRLGNPGIDLETLRTLFEVMALRSRTPK